MTKDNELYILTLYDMILNSVEIFAIVYRTIDRMIFIQIVTGVFSGRGGLGWQSEVILHNVLALATLGVM